MTISKQTAITLNRSIYYAGFLRLFLSCLLITAGLTAIAAPADQWTIPSGTKAHFSIKGMLGIRVNGTLKFSNAAIIFDPSRPEKTVMNVTLNVSTLATGIGKRDRHLKSADFFDATQYPAISFHATSVAHVSGNNYTVTGDLRIKSVSRKVTIPFTFTGTGNQGTFTGKFRISRTDYGVGSGKENGMGKEVRISLKVPVVRG